MKMALVLNSAKPAVRDVQRMIQELLRKGERALRRGHLSLEVRIHSVRQRLKRVRALMSLIRSALPEKVYQSETGRLRKLARPLSAARDAQVALQVFDGIPGRDYGATEDEHAAMRLSLQSRADQELNDLDAADTLFRTAALLRSAQHRIKRWDLHGGGWSILGIGLRREYSRARDSHRIAAEQPTLERLHDLRKQTKSFGHQLEILKPMASDELSRHVGDLEDLADWLGMVRDWSLLRTWLRRHASACRPLGPFQASDQADVRQKLAQELESRMNQLTTRALHASGQEFRLAPKVFVRHLHIQWKAWRDS